jgi:hypothetical protein
MIISKRVVITFLSAVIVLFVGMLFWPFILNNIIKPTALVLWLLLRILVLSIDQKYFWYVVTFVATIFFLRLLSRQQIVVQSDAYHLETNATTKNIGHWRALLTYDSQNIQDENIFKRELLHLLASLYVSKKHALNNFDIYHGLQQGDIPLPEHIHTYLFSQEPRDTGGPIIRFIQSIQKTPRKWIRRWTGQEEAEHYQRIANILSFMEASMEIKNDDR